MSNSFSANLSILILKISGEACHRPPLSVLNPLKNLIVVWKSQGKSGNFIPSGDWTPCKAIWLISRQIVFDFSWTGLSPYSIERSNSVGPPGHSTKTQKISKHFILELLLEYSQLFSHVTETVLMDVRHDHAVDTHLRFACIKHFCLHKMKNDISCNSGCGNNCQQTKGFDSCQ